jgi:hypothetical protein
MAWKLETGNWKLEMRLRCDFPVSIFQFPLSNMTKPEELVHAASSSKFSNYFVGLVL